MGLKALDHVVIAVSDCERSNAFYRDVLGVEVVEVEYGRFAYVLPRGQHREPGRRAPALGLIVHG